MIDLTMRDRRMTIVNIFAPNNDDSDFVTGITDVVETSDNYDRIIAGDFNCVLNDIKDKKGGAAVHSNQNMRVNCLIHRRGRFSRCMQRATSA